MTSQQSLTGAWQFRQAMPADGEEAGWLPATVPGGVHTDLLALGRIPDPFVGDNERRVQWVAEATGNIAACSPSTPELLRQPHIWLVCDGLDTLATVSLNGHVLGQTDNMFRQYRWDVKPLLKAGENELRIAFASVVKYAARAGSDPQPARRLAGHPRRPARAQGALPVRLGLGPAAPAHRHLEGHPAGRVRRPLAWPTSTCASATRTAQVRVEARHRAREGWTSGPVRRVLTRHRARRRGGQPSAADLPARPTATSSRSTSQIRSCGGRTATASSRCTGVEVRTARRRRGRGLDAPTRSGCARSSCARSRTSGASRSQFVVNGVPIFAKGSNWIPADSFPTRLDRREPGRR